MNCDVWHVTCDMWHVTQDTWHVRGWTFYQNFSSLSLTVCDLWYYEDLEEKADWIGQWINQLINHEAVYRTAPATPGLLNITLHKFGFKKYNIKTHIELFQSCCFFFQNFNLMKVLTSKECPQYILHDLRPALKVSMKIGKTTELEFLVHVQLMHASRLHNICITFVKIPHMGDKASLDADSSTDAIGGWTKNTPKPNFFEKGKKSSKTQKLKNI